MKDSKWANAFVRVLACWLALIALALAPARGQDEDEIDEDDPFSVMDRMWSGDGPEMPPDISRSDVTFFVRMARLSDEQREAALELHAAYRERHRAASVKLREYQEALGAEDWFRRSTDKKIEEAVAPVREDYYKFTRRIKDELIVDMKTVLTEDQQDRWEWFERRAEWGSMWGLGLDGHSAPDLGLLVHRVSGTEPVSDEVLLTLARFYSEMLGLKKERDESQRRRREAAEAREHADEAAGGDEEAQAEDGEAEPELDPEVLAADSEEKEFQKRGMEIIQRAASKIQGLLPSEIAERFEERYLTEMGRDFDPFGAMSRPDLAFTRALAVESLSDEQRDQLKTLQSEVRRERLTRLRSAMAELLNRKESDEEKPNEATQMAEMVKYQQAMAAQKALLSKVRGVLTVEQQREAGPPVAKPVNKTPNFDAEDEPAPEIKDPPKWMGNIESELGLAAVNDLDLAFLKRAAPLADDQYAAAKDLFAAYTARRTLASKKMAAFQQSIFERMRTGDTPDFLDKSLMRVYVKFMAYDKRIKDELMSDVRSLLTDEQSAAYDAIKRRVKRKVLSENDTGADLLASRIDLVSVAEGVFVDTEMPAEARAVLDRYEEDIAPAIDRLNAFKAQESKRMAKMVEGGGAMDLGDAMGLFNGAEKQTKKMIVEVRDHNLKCFKEVLTHMPETHRAEFELAFYSRADPYARMESFMPGSRTEGSPDDLLREAQVLEGLSPEQAATLSAAAHEHTVRKAEVMRESFEMQLEEENPDAGTMERMRERDWDEYRERAESVAKSEGETVDRMLAALTEEQRERLPKRYRPAPAVERPRFEED